MKVITDLSVTSAPPRARNGWHPGWLFRDGTQGAWYDPSDPTTLFQDAAGTTPVTASGDPVALVLDKSGNANHASVTVAAARPIFRDVAGYRYLEFDGVDDFLTTTSIDLTAQPAMTTSAGIFRPDNVIGGTVLGRKREGVAVQALEFQGISASISALGHWLAMRSNVSVNQATGSTSFILQVCRSVAMVAHVRPPPSEAAS